MLAASSATFIGLTRASATRVENSISWMLFTIVSGVIGVLVELAPGSAGPSS